MKISKVIAFLEGVMENGGDMELQSITGFWIRQIPATGERVVVASIGNGKAVGPPEANDGWVGCSRGRGS